MIIIKLTSTQYPNLPLFLLLAKHLWYSQGYHFQVMPQMEGETTMMMHNITPVLIFKYREDVKIQFFPEAVEAKKYDYWYETLKRVMYKIVKNMA